MSSNIKWNSIMTSMPTKRFLLPKLIPAPQDFPRTIQSDSGILLGFGAPRPSRPRRQAMLPNYDGRCRRYERLRAQLLEEANREKLQGLQREVEEMLLPVMGPEPMKLGGERKVFVCWEEVSFFFFFFFFFSSFFGLEMNLGKMGANSVDRVH